MDENLTWLIQKTPPPQTHTQRKKERERERERVNAIELYSNKISDNPPISTSTPPFQEYLPFLPKCLVPPQVTQFLVGISEMSAPPEIVVGTHFYVQHGTKTILVLLPANEEASWSLLPSSVSLLSDSIVQPENTYSCILKVTGQL